MALGTEAAMADAARVAVTAAVVGAVPAVKVATTGPEPRTAPAKVRALTDAPKAVADADVAVVVATATARAIARKSALRCRVTPRRAAAEI